MTTKATAVVTTAAAKVKRRQPARSATARRAPGGTKRVALVEPAPSRRRLIDPYQSSLEFFSTGCQLLDCAFGSGLPLARTVNIVGDKSVGKTLLAIEACANFARAYPKGAICYAECEAAFDKPYAMTLGLPIDRVRFREGKEILHTVEDWEEDLKAWVAKRKREPGLYVLDSLDALSDRQELARKTGETTIPATKARAMSALFRRVNGMLSESRTCLIVVSQVRSRIGVFFGRDYERSGGRALDFYASLVVYLAKLRNRDVTIEGFKRVTGVDIRAKVEKNKIAMPFRQCDFRLRFAYGIDDLMSNLDFLDISKRTEAVLDDDSDKGVTRYLAAVAKMSDEEYRAECRRVAGVTKMVWGEIEERFAPPRKKYG